MDPANDLFGNARILDEKRVRILLARAVTWATHLLVANTDSSAFWNDWGS